ncbi:hypothetical protein DVH24_007130 [Malus domestica]|uniref:LOV domain-containing protein n=1 Tax=Malus domestica TaxID=3750 RepID=A0A498HHS7_MALDO|nr:hypothetical protein DVH24_007130 [Malus domestica]
MESELGLIEQSFISRYSLWVQEALGELPDSFTITDPWISGHPIVFASKEFLKMSGYSKNEVVGRNGRVFQGPGTCRRSVMEVREAIREERAVQVNLLNYRKDGTPFWMLFHMCPVFGKEDGRVIHFVGVQVPISRKPRRSGGRNGVGLCEEGSRMSEIVYGSCRKEVCFDSLVDLGRVLSLESALDDADSRGFNIEESCEASDVEKTRAATAINNILSVLTHYSELTGRLVCGKRCNLCGVGLLSSALNISLGRIKQSFKVSCFLKIADDCTFCLLRYDCVAFRTDSHLPDMPIVYASDAFFKLTGYARHEVLGRNCRFLSGADTDPSMIYRIDVSASSHFCLFSPQIKESIQNETACTVRILNYRKDKSSFWNLLHISPIRNASGKIAYFVGVQMEEGCKNQVEHGLSPEMRQLSTVGAVRIAVRSLTMGAGASKSISGNLSSFCSKLSDSLQLQAAHDDWPSSPRFEHLDQPVLGNFLHYTPSMRYGCTGKIETANSALRLAHVCDAPVIEWVY